MIPNGNRWIGFSNGHISHLPSRHLHQFSRPLSLCGSAHTHAHIATPREGVERTAGPKNKKRTALPTAMSSLCLCAANIYTHCRAVVSVFPYEFLSHRRISLICLCVDSHFPIFPCASPKPTGSTTEDIFIQTESVVSRARDSSARFFHLYLVCGPCIVEPFISVSETKTGITVFFFFWKIKRKTFSTFEINSKNRHTASTAFWRLAKFESLCGLCACECALLLVIVFQKRKRVNFSHFFHVRHFDWVFCELGFPLVNFCVSVSVCPCPCCCCNFAIKSNRTYKNHTRDLVRVPSCERTWSDDLAEKRKLQRAPPPPSPQWQTWDLTRWTGTKHTTAEKNKIVNFWYVVFRGECAKECKGNSKVSACQNNESDQHCWPFTKQYIVLDRRLWRVLRAIGRVVANEKGGTSIHRVAATVKVRAK